MHTFSKRERKERQQARLCPQMLRKNFPYADCTALWQDRCWKCWATTEPLFTVKQNKPSSVPYLILAGQTLCPAAPPLSTWKNCPLQMGSSLTYQVGYWCSALGNWQLLQHQEYLTCKVSSWKQIKRNITELFIRVKFYDKFHYAKIVHTSNTHALTAWPKSIWELI